MIRICFGSFCLRSSRPITFCDTQTDSSSSLEVSITDIQFCCQWPPCRKTCQTYWEHPSTPSLAISIARSRFDMEQIFLAKSGECYGTGSYFSGNVRPVKVNNCRICLQELRRRLRNISNSALACSRLRDSRVPFSFPSSPLKFAKY